MYTSLRSGDLFVTSDICVSFQSVTLFQHTTMSTQLYIHQALAQVYSGNHIEYPRNSLIDTNLKSRTSCESIIMDSYIDWKRIEKVLMYNICGPSQTYVKEVKRWAIEFILTINKTGEQERREHTYGKPLWNKDKPETACICGSWYTQYESVQQSQRRCEHSPTRHYTL